MDRPDNIATLDLRYVLLVVDELMQAGGEKIVRTHILPTRSGCIGALP